MKTSHIFTSSVAITLVFIAGSAEGRGFKGVRNSVRNLKARVDTKLNTGLIRHKELNQLNRALSTQIRHLKQQARRERKQHQDSTATRKAVRDHCYTRNLLWEGRSNILLNLDRLVGVVGIGIGLTNGGALLPLGLLNLGIGEVCGRMERNKIVRAATSAASMGIPVGPELRQMGVMSLEGDLARLHRRQDRVARRNARHTRWSQGQNRMLRALGKALVKRDERRTAKIEKRIQQQQTALDILQR